MAVVNLWSGLRRLADGQTTVTVEAQTLRQMFAARVLRFVPVVANTRSSAGGLVRWPIKAAIPVGFVLLGLQGVAEFFKRVTFLRSGEGLSPDYERPLQ